MGFLIVWGEKFPHYAGSGTEFKYIVRPRDQGWICNEHTNVNLFMASVRRLVTMHGVPCNVNKVEGLAG